MLDRFFAKMKTSVKLDPEEDAKEVALSFKEPHRFDSKKICPKSNWEFYKWNKLDAIGFLSAVLVLFAILAMLKLVISIGG